jgi:hypothetical protein
MTRRLLRALVLRTNSWPVAGALYRVPYRMAAHALARAAGEIPEISGLFARGSYAAGQWAPGRSDIDVTAILQSPSLPAVRRFAARTAELRRRFPMIGEVEFLDQACLSAYSASAFTGFQSSRWLPLAGRLPPPDFYHHGAAHLQRDRLSHALRVYRLDIPPALFGDARQTLARLTGKILRTLDLPLPPGLDNLPVPALITLAFQSLQTACAGTPAPPFPASLPSVIRPNSLYTITDVPPSPDDFGTPLQTRIPCTASMLASYLTLTDPVEHLLLTQRGVLPPDFPLSDSQLRESVCRYAVDIYSYPFREEALAATADSFQSLLYGWLLWTLRYLESGQRGFEHSAISAYCQQRHPCLNLAPATPDERFALLLATVRRIASIAEPATLLDTNPPQV